MVSVSFLQTFHYFCELELCISLSSSESLQIPTQSPSNLVY
jgi:hypothetical protein